MKAGWQQIRLGDLTESDTPITYGVIKPGESGDVRFVRGGDISNGFILENQLRTITREISEQYKRTLLRGGELLMCLVGQPGQVAVVPPSLAGANIARQVGLIRLRSEISTEFISYFFQSPDGQASLGVHTGGSVQQVINLGDLRTVAVPVPKKAEQVRIVAILDEAFDGIATARANAEKNLQNARALFESHLQSVFTERGEGWVEKPLGDMATFRNGINFTKASKGDSIKILGVKDFQQKYWAPLDGLDSIIPDGALPDSDTLAQNDIVFVRSNGNPELIGRCVLIGEVSERITHSGFTIRARLGTSEILPTYLCHFLKSNDARRKMVDGGNGANIRSLNQGTLSSLVIRFPKAEDEQVRIVGLLERLQNETQRLESLCQRKLAALDELKQSLLHQAFSGQI